MNKPRGRILSGIARTTITAVIVALGFTTSLVSPASATCGTESTAGSNTVVTFTSGCTWTVPSGVTTIAMLVVAGGGGGGSGYGGGGSGGQVISVPITSVTAGQSLVVTVGQGGNGSTWDSQDGTEGGTSSVVRSAISLATAVGGGYGGSRGLSPAGSAGAYGGGGNDQADPAVRSVGTVAHSGGYGTPPIDSPFMLGAGGGGGGATANGGNAAAPVSGGAEAIGGDGGQGQSSSITGSAVVYGSGGGGGGPAGGIGGTNAGRGGYGSESGATAPTTATANTGGGGGGGSGHFTTGSGSDGAAGVVIFSYAVAAQVPPAPTGLSASSGNGSATISFTQSGNGGSAITNYKYSINGGATWIALSPADANSPITIPSLTNNTNYTIQIRAVNAIGDGAASATVSVKPSPSNSNKNSTPTPTPTPTPTSTPTATPTPTPSPSSTSPGKKNSNGTTVYDDVSEIIDDIVNEIDDCDVEVVRPVCESEAGKKAKDAANSVAEKAKENASSQTTAEEQAAAEEQAKRAQDLADELEDVEAAQEETTTTDEENRAATVLIYDDPPLDKITICHSTSSKTNPYVTITVSIEAWVKKGHGDHEGDIVAGSGTIPSKNMGNGGTAIYENSCMTPSQKASLETPAPTATPTPTNSPTPSPTNTPTPTPTNSPSPTNSPTPTPTNSPSPSSTNTPAPANTPTPTSSPTPTNTPAPAPTNSPSPSPTPEPSESETATPTPSESATESPTPEATETETPSPTDSATPTESATPTATPTEEPPRPLTVAEAIDDVTKYTKQAKKYHDRVVKNIALELELIDDEINTKKRIPKSSELIEGLEKEKALKEKLDALWVEVSFDSVNLDDPNASAALLGATEQALAAAESLRITDVALFENRAGILKQLNAFWLWLLPPVALGLWWIIAWRRRRLYVDTAKCVSCGLCAKQFPELFVMAADKKAELRPKNDGDEIPGFRIVRRADVDAAKDSVDLCEVEAIGYERKVPREVIKQIKQRNKNRLPAKG